jgi:hypothetical protein
MNKVYTLLQDVQITRHTHLKKGQEIGLVNNVVYMGGYPISFDMQKVFKDWMDNNMDKLKLSTRQF